MVGREHDRLLRVCDSARGPRTVIHAKHRASGRIHVRLTQPADHADQRRGGSSSGSRPARRPQPASAARSSSALHVAQRLGCGKPRFVHARLQPVFERHHQLDAFERAEPQLIERRCRRRPPDRRQTSRSAPPPDRRPRRARSRAARPSRPTRESRCRLSFLRALGARQRAVAPDRKAADRVDGPAASDSPRDNRFWVGVRLRARARHARVPARRLCDRPRPTRARPAAHSSDPLHIVRKDVQPFRRDDHFFLAALDEDAALVIDRRRCRRCAASPPRRRVRPGRRAASGSVLAPSHGVIPGGDVLAAHEDLAVVRDLAPRRRRSACRPIRVLVLNG